VSRVGLGRHGQLDDAAGDPLDGLVNLFDVGLVLAAAFLIAGLAMGAKQVQDQRPPEDAERQTLTQPERPQRASGEGQAVGQVYRLPDGRLVLVGAGDTEP
jgi:hypothetical protein